MYFDSDTTIILNSGDEEEAMDVEEIADVYVEREVVVASASVATDLEDQMVQYHVSPHQASEHVQAADIPQVEVVERTEVVNDENRTAQSPSLLSGSISSDQNVVPTELTVKDEVCNNETERSPQKRPHSDTEDDGNTCPICLDNWTNIGEHRICALRCGHLFGSSCIMRWFSSQKKKNCPTCKKKAMKGDIRYIYAKKLIAMDVSELEEIKQQLDNVTQEKNRIQIELTRSVCREHLIMQQIEDLKKKVQFLDSALEVKEKFSHSQASSDNDTNDIVRLYMDKSLEICKEGGCRVLDYNSNHGMVASMKSPNNLFRGFGVRRIDVSTYRPTAFLPLHTMSIRDVRFHPLNPWLLSVSLDKTVKVVDIHNNEPISAYRNGDGALWSCCWDFNNSNMFFVGKQQGSVAKFDVRKMSKPVCVLEVPGDLSPVVSVAGIGVSPGNPVASGGIVACKLNSLWIFENTANEYTRYSLPMEGPFISMMYQNTNRQLLVSTRSNTRIPFSRHHLCNIAIGTSDNLLCNTIHCFPGSSTQKLLSRSCIVSNKSKEYVAAHQESLKSVFLWNVSTGRKGCSLPARDSVLDLCSVNTDNTNYLASLTEKKLEFFKFA